MWTSYHTQELRINSGTSAHCSGNSTAGRLFLYHQATQIKQESPVPRGAVQERKRGPFCWGCINKTPPAYHRKVVSQSPSAWRLESLALVDSMSGEDPFPVLLFPYSFVGRTWGSLGSDCKDNNPVQKLYFPIPAL